jgi:hypothetical protein
MMDSETQTQLDDMAVVEPLVKSLVETNGLIVDLAVPLGACCPVGSLCCERCARNIRFRGGDKHFCFGDDELIARVLSGEKPYGSIGRRHRDDSLRNALSDAGLVVVNDGVRNEWGFLVYGFVSVSTATKRFSDFVDLNAVKVVCGVELQDKALQEHARSDDFINEDDTMIERGIMYGYPLWSSIALHLKHERACE